MPAPPIRYGAEVSALVAVRGHPFDRSAFGDLFDEMEGVRADIVDQPAASRLMTPDGLRGYDALVLYDMPGLDFAAADRPGYVEPDPALKAGLKALLAEGKGIVALHHAIAGWPAWEGYADILGGRFLYRAGPLRGAQTPDSGYRHEVAYEAEAVDQAHPVLAGVPARFPLVDELYLYEVFEGEVTPLLRARHDFARDNFYSAELAVAKGEMFSNAGWAHPDGSDLIGWTREVDRSRLVYLQPGDGPSTYADPNYRRLVRNAIDWVARRS